MRGIDISNWQAGINVKNLDVAFCIFKATEGLGYKDPFAKEFHSQCVKKGIPWGFYHFARENNPKDEAREFYNTCKDWIDFGLPVLDYETTNANNANWCDNFCKEFKRLSGVTPVLYISASRCSQYAGSWCAENCALWVAGYPYERTDWPGNGVAMPYNIAPWKSCIIWQFTSSLILSGFNGRLDGNIAYITKSDWAKLSGSKKQPSKEETEPKRTTKGKTDRDLAVEVINGVWKSGADRRKLLGNRYEGVQKVVNAILLEGDYTELAQDVIAGKYGNGQARRDKLGALYDQVQQRVNELMS